MTWRQQAACEGKERFAGFTLAQIVARRLSQRRDMKAKAYACRHCGGFHVGTMDFERPQGRPKGKRE